MYKLLIIFALLGGILEARSQTCIVKSFRWLDPRQVKFSPTPVPDVGGKKCAVIRVVSKQSGYDFDFGVPGNVVAAVPKGDDIWLWVPEGVQNVTISNKKLGFLCNYPLGTELEADVVYVMVLDTNKVDKTRQGQVETKWVTLDCMPSLGANLFIDDISAGKTPFYGSLPMGTHKIRMEMSKEIKEQEITIGRDELRLEIRFQNVLKAYQNDGSEAFGQDPEFKGGLEEMFKFLRENVHYPKLAEEQKIEGTVFAQFVVGITGKLTKVKILRGIGGGCDEEAVRVIEMMPNWNPGRNANGFVVPVIYQIPIKFQLPKK